MPDMLTIAIGVSAEKVSVCLSCGFSVQTWLNGVRSCLGRYLMGPKEHNTLVPIFHTDLMQPLVITLASCFN